MTKLTIENKCDKNVTFGVGGAQAKVDMKDFIWYAPPCTPSQP